MRHSDYRGLEKNAQAYDEEYEGVSARSVDDHYNYPFSPNSSNELMNDSATGRQEHSLFSFVATKKPKPKKKNKDTAAAAVNKVLEEEPSPLFEFQTQSPRGRLPSRDFDDTQFVMESDDDLRRPMNEGNRSA